MYIFNFSNLEVEGRTNVFIPAVLLGVVLSTFSEHPLQEDHRDCGCSVLLSVFLDSLGGK